MKDLVEEIAKAIVDYPDDVKVNVVEGSQTTIIEISTAKGDLGKIIGKEGKTAKAMRVLLNAVASKLGKRASLEIIE